MGYKWYETSHFEMVCKWDESGWKYSNIPLHQKLSLVSKYVGTYYVRSHLDRYHLPVHPIPGLKLPPQAYSSISLSSNANLVLLSLFNERHFTDMDLQKICLSPDHIV